jgi:hypothetical protein
VAKQRLEQEIIGLFARDITAAYSIHQISKTLGKAYPHINRKVNVLIESGVLGRVVIGRAHLCSINLHSARARNLLAAVEIEWAEHAKSQGDVGRARKKLEAFSNRFPFTIAFLSGRDLHLVTPVPGVFETPTWELPFHIHVHEVNAFKELLLEDKTLLTEHTLLLGYELYFSVLASCAERLAARYSSILGGGG